MEPLLILGLDGLDPYFLEKHSEELPNLSKLDSGILESTLPPITVPAWACSFTGKLPERHDRFDFQAIDFRDYSFRHTGDVEFLHQEFWSFVEGKAAIADVPGAKVHEIDGWIIGGVFDVSEDDTYPAELGKEIENDIGEFRIEGLENAPESMRREKAFEFFERRRETLDWLLDNREADVYFTVFRLPDTIMHHGSSDRDMLRAYRRCDSYLGDLMERDLTVLALSDHGAVRANRRFSVNTWLRENGFLETEDSSSGTGLVRSMALRAGEFAERLGFRDLLVRANRAYGKVVGEEFVKKELDLDALDFENTEAFSYMTGVCRYAGIWINDDRFPNNAVDDREAKKQELRNEMEQHELVEKVLTKQEAFEVDAKTFPDLVVVLGEKVKNDSDLKPNVTGKISSYMHRKEGFIGVHGDVFEMGEEKRELVDLAPTVLHYFGEEIPESMDGEVMELFSDDSEPGSRAPTYSEEEIADLDV